jgi:hypothetical protein
MIMKTIVSGLVALSILTGFVGSASAQEDRQDRQDRGQTYKNARSGDHEFLAEKRPFGSSSWWRQMDREDRGGQG